MTKENRKGTKVYLTFKSISMSIPTKQKRYKIVTQDQAVELLIYITFRFLMVFKFTTFNRLLVFADWSDKDGKSKVRRNVLRKRKLLQRHFFIGYKRSTCKLGE